MVELTLQPVPNILSLKKSSHHAFRRDHSDHFRSKIEPSVSPEQSYDGLRTKPYAYICMAHTPL